MKNLSKSLSFGLALAGLMVPATLRAGITLDFAVASGNGTIPATGNTATLTGQTTSYYGDIILANNVSTPVDFGKLLYHPDVAATGLSSDAITRTLNFYLPSDLINPIGSALITQTLQENTAGGNVNTWTLVAGGPTSVSLGIYGTLDVSTLLKTGSYQAGVGNSIPPTTVGADFTFNPTPVPEPTTLIAGALLLVPMGLSTLRLRRIRLS